MTGGEDCCKGAERCGDGSDLHGLHQTPEQIVATAIQEGVDGVGLSILSGAHMAHIRSVLRLLKKEKAEDIFVFAGGIIRKRMFRSSRGWGCWRSLPRGLRPPKSSILFGRQQVHPVRKKGLPSRVGFF